MSATSLAADKADSAGQIHREFSGERVFEDADDTRSAAMPTRLIDPPRPLSGSMRKLGAYAAVALIVPGGSVIAFVLWALQQRGWLTARTWRTFFAMIALGTGLIFPG